MWLSDSPIAPYDRQVQAYLRLWQQQLMTFKSHYPESELPEIVKTSLVALESRLFPQQSADKRVAIPDTGQILPLLDQPSPWQDRFLHYLSLSPSVDSNDDPLVQGYGFLMRLDRELPTLEFITQYHAWLLSLGDNYGQSARLWYHKRSIQRIQESIDSVNREQQQMYDLLSRYTQYIRSVGFREPHIDEDQIYRQFKNFLTKHGQAIEKWIHSQPHNGAKLSTKSPNKLESLSSVQTDQAPSPGLEVLDEDEAYKMIRTLCRNQRLESADSSAQFSASSQAKVSVSAEYNANGSAQAHTSEEDDSDWQELSLDSFSHSSCNSASSDTTAHMPQSSGVFHDHPSVKKRLVLRTMLAHLFRNKNEKKSFKQSVPWSVELLKRAVKRKDMPTLYVWTNQLQRHPNRCALASDMTLQSLIHCLEGYLFLLLENHLQGQLIFHIEGRRHLLPSLSRQYYALAESYRDRLQPNHWLAHMSKYWSELLLRQYIGRQPKQSLAKIQSSHMKQQSDHQWLRWLLRLQSLRMHYNQTVKPYHWALIILMTSCVLVSGGSLLWALYQHRYSMQALLALEHALTLIQFIAATILCVQYHKKMIKQNAVLLDSVRSSFRPVATHELPVELVNESSRTVNTSSISNQDIPPPGPTQTRS